MKIPKIVFSDASDDCFIGLNNAIKSQFITGNTFEFFEREKPNIVFVNSKTFDRPIFKNVVSSKCKLVMMDTLIPETKMKQVSDAGIQNLVLEPIVGFDNVRFSKEAPIKIDPLAKIWFAQKSSFIHYYSDLDRDRLLIYCDTPLQNIPEYAGFTDSCCNIIRSVDKVYDYCNSLTYTSNTLRIIGYNGRIETNKKNLPSHREIWDKLTYKALSKQLFKKLGINEKNLILD